MIYLDNAATTKKKPESVISAVTSAMTTLGNASRGASDESLGADRIIFGTRKMISELFNLKSPKSVVFTMNSTEALNIAIKGVLETNDHVITTDMEHNSVLRPLNSMDIEVDYLPLDTKSRLKTEFLPKLVKENTRAVIINHASNVTGEKNNLREIGEFCEKNHLLFIVDASQTAGAFKIDMQADKIDILCFTGHKSLLGPQGTGGLCVQKDVYVRPLLFGGTGIDTYNKSQPDKMPTRLEAGTLNSHGIAGLKAGIEYIMENNMQELTKKSQALAQRFYEGVNLPGVKIYGDHENKDRAPVVSINIGERDSSEVSFILSEKYNISTRPGAHCAPRLHESLGTKDQGMVRFSFSHSNTEEEVDLAIAAVKEILNT